MSGQTKTKQFKILKRTRGITLIALVITIIVLLILAGVSIATLTGQDNIMENAANARDNTNEAAEKEKVELAVASASIEEQGNLTTDSLKEAIGNQFGADKKENLTENVDGSWTFEGDIKSYNIDKEGMVLAHVSSSKVNAKIGQIVNYDFGLSEDVMNEVGSWRVFYASNEELFLISTNTVQSNIAFGGNKGIPLAPYGKFSNSDSGDDYTYTDEEYKYKGASDVFSPKTRSGEGYSYSNVEYGKTYNELWYKTGTTDDNTRSKATAYLCDPANWTKYIGSNAPKGTYAVGGPTKELLVRSWVASGQTDQDVETVLEDTKVYDNKYDEHNGYMYNKPDILYVSNPISSTILDGLYNTGRSYWLASPSGYAKPQLCYVITNSDGTGSLIHANYYNIGVGVRPIVSIPISNVQIENGKVTIK